MRASKFSIGTGAACLLIASALLSAAPAAAGGPSYDLHGRDFQTLTPAELQFWQGGHWVYDLHDGHLAWWWNVGDTWYSYQTPSYPYPHFVSQTDVTYNAPPAPAAQSAAGPSWYYCDRPAGYTPDVKNCEVPWREVTVPPSTVAEK